MKCGAVSIQWKRFKFEKIERNEFRLQHRQILPKTELKNGNLNFTCVRVQDENEISRYFLLKGKVLNVNKNMLQINLSANLELITNFVNS